MAFGAEFIEKASREYKIRSVESDYKIVTDLISQAIAIVAEVNKNVRQEDVKIYIHGSYANQTNTFFPSRLEVAVELLKTLEYDPNDEMSLGYRVHNNYFVETTFEFNPSDFAKLLFLALQELIGEACVMSDKFIEISKGKVEGFGMIKHIVEILPCFTFKFREKIDETDLVRVEEILQIQGNNIKVSTGVLFFDRSVSTHIVTFPRLHTSNGIGKNLATNGNFLRMTRLFKTLNTVGYREADFLKTRGYFIQCLLFNVPNELYILNDVEGEPNGDQLKIIFYKVLNHLLYCEMQNFASQNLVWHLFGKAEEFWSIEEAKVFVKDIKKLHDNFPSARTELA